MPKRLRVFFRFDRRLLGQLPRLVHVSRARITQIMNLNFLAPDIQEEILVLPRVERGRDPIREHAVRPIAATANWAKHQRMWHATSGRTAATW